MWPGVWIIPLFFFVAILIGRHCPHPDETQKLNDLEYDRLKKAMYDSAKWKG